MQCSREASLAASRGASLPDLVKEFQRHVDVVVEDHRARARYDQKIRDEGRMGWDLTGKRKHFSPEEVEAKRDRAKKYRADVASGERVPKKYDEEENVESLVKKQERDQKKSDSNRGLHAARVEESHDMAIELPAGVERRTGPGGRGVGQNGLSQNGCGSLSPSLSLSLSLLLSFDPRLACLRLRRARAVAHARADLV